MSIGKNSILRVQNAEKSGAAQIVTEAPDMENSTVIEEPKKVAPKKTAGSAKSAKAAPKKRTAKKSAPKKAAKTSEITYCAIGDDMPVYLL